jgi:hypothetical protein
MDAVRKKDVKKRCRVCRREGKAAGSPRGRRGSRELMRSSLRGDDLTSRVARLARPQHHPPALAWADNGLIHRSMWADAVGW